MKKLYKKAFTLVELLVVIAILGVLAAVGVVSYTSLTEKARKSNDENIVAQMNVILGASILDDTSTCEKVFDYLENNDVDFTNLKASSKNAIFGYDHSTKQIGLYAKDTRKLTYPSNAKTGLVAASDVVFFCSESDDINQSYPVFIVDNFSDNITFTSPTNLYVASGKKINSTVTYNYAGNAINKDSITIEGAIETLTLNTPNTLVKFDGTYNTLNNGSYAIYKPNATMIVLKHDVTATSSDLERVCIVDGQVKGSSYAFNDADFDFLSGICDQTVGTDVFVKLPQYSYYRSISDNLETIYIGETNCSPVVSIHPAFTRYVGSSLTNIEALYVGKYEATLTSGVPMSTSTTFGSSGSKLAVWRTAAQNKGTNTHEYGLIDYKTVSVIQFLGMAKYATLNLGVDVFGFSLISGGIMEMCDGIYYSGTSIYYGQEGSYDDYSKYAAISDSIDVFNGNTSCKSCYITEVSYDENQSWLMFPVKTALGQSSDKNYCDWAKIVDHGTSKGLITWGGYKGDYPYQACGLFNIVGDDVIGGGNDGFGGYYGTRIIYIPQ